MELFLPLTFQSEGFSILHILCYTFNFFKFIFDFILNLKVTYHTSVEIKNSSLKSAAFELLENYHDIIIHKQKILWG